MPQSMIGHHETSTNLSDSEKKHTTSAKAVRITNTYAGSMIPLNTQITDVVICKVCTTPCSPTDEKCNACGCAIGVLLGGSVLSSTQELSISDSGNMVSSFGANKYPRTQLTNANEADSAVTRENNGATSQFQAGDRVEYKGNKMIVVRRARPFHTERQEYLWWWIKAENTDYTIRVKAKNMKKVDDFVGTSSHGTVKTASDIPRAEPV